MLPASVVSRAKRRVMALQLLPLVTSFWIEELRAARVAVGRRKIRNFIMVVGWFSPLTIGHYDITCVS
jgi:hypothetical protein